MSRMLRHVMKSGLVLAIAAFAWVPAESVYAPGRDFSRCSRHCDYIRLACHDRCQEDCNTVGGTDEQQQACLARCADGCVDLTHRCKRVCNYYYIKGYDDPFEP